MKAFFSKHYDNAADLFVVALAVVGSVLVLAAMFS